MTIDELIDRMNSDPNGPKVEKTPSGGFRTISYCKKLENGVTVHVGHREDEPCFPPS